VSAEKKGAKTKEKTDHATSKDERKKTVARTNGEKKALFSTSSLQQESGKILPGSAAGHAKKNRKGGQRDPGGEPQRQDRWAFDDSYGRLMSELVGGG